MAPEPGIWTAGLKRCKCVSCVELMKVHTALPSHGGQAHLLTHTRMSIAFKALPEPAARAVSGRAVTTGPATVCLAMLQTLSPALCPPLVPLLRCPCTAVHVLLPLPPVPQHPWGGESGAGVDRCLVRGVL